MRDPHYHDVGVWLPFGPVQHRDPVHRLLLIRSSPEHPEKFLVTGDSTRPEVSDEHPATFESVGATPWHQKGATTGYDAPSAILPCTGSLFGLSLWHSKVTGVALDYDFAAAGVSEMKVVTSGELHVVCEGREYVALAGDTMMYLTDPEDRGEDGAVRPFVVRFLSDHECTTVWTDFGVSASAEPERGFV
jgi:hypothetical protein